jgi:signal transduction histidine kinase
MKKSSTRIIILITLIIGLIIALMGWGQNLSKSVPTASAGKLDLTDWCFDKEGAVDIKGEWEYYWNQLLNPKDFKMYDGKCSYESIVGMWNLKNSLQGKGCVTYRLFIYLPNNLEYMGIKIPPVQTSYKLWIDGKLKVSSGEVGTNKEDAKPAIDNKIVFFEPKNNKIEIVIQISNFASVTGGLWEPLKIGNQNNTIDLRDRGLMFDFVNFGSLIALAVYHFIMYFNKRDKKMLLYSGIAIFLMGIRSLTTGEFNFQMLFPYITWELYKKVSILTFIPASLFFSLYIKELFPNEISKKVLSIIKVVTIFYVLSVIIFPAFVYMIFIDYYQIVQEFIFLYIFYVTLKAFIKKREGALVSFISSLLVIVVSLNDTLYFRGIINTGRFSSTGILLFALMNAYNISYLISSAFRRVDELSKSLNDLNESLEKKVMDRTCELEKSRQYLIKTNERLLMTEKSRRYLISNISHDLRTPITSIQGYVETMLEGIIKDKEDMRIYLTKVLGKVYDLRALIDDFFLLSQLESKKVQFQFHTVTPHSFVQDIYEYFEIDVKSRGIDFEMEADELNGDQFIIKVDITRMHQVFGNIIGNALRYTEKGGYIKIQYNIVNEDRALIKIKDTGIGINKEELAHIFERYYKADDGQSGLGLSIAKEIVEIHEGSIWAESEKEKGTVFNIILPIYEKS